MSDAPARIPAHPLGVPLMDDDHATLEAMMEKVSTTADADLPALLEEVGAEVEAHFAREEALMAEKGVPVLMCHIAQHRRILDLITLARGLTQESQRPRLRTFLEEMLPGEIEGHVLSVDRVTATFLAGKLAPEATDNLRLPAESCCTG